MSQNKFKLDFDIFYAKDRLEAIKTIPLQNLNKKELETITNYILYGKEEDKDDTSVVDRKEIQIKTKFSSFQRDKTTSLEGLMESPTFDENIFQKNKTIYKNVKPSIDREKHKDVPGMKELWDEIDKLQKVYDQNTGKEEKEETTPHLSPDELYYMRHQLIQLRTQQYLLLDTYYPTIQGKKNKAEFHSSSIDFQFNYPILPRGVMQSQHDTFFTNPFTDEKHIPSQSLEAQLGNSFNPFYSEDSENFETNLVSGRGDSNNFYLDFRNEDHLYYLIQYYYDLKAQAEGHPDSLINNLIWTLDFYISKAKLSDQQLLIVNDKKWKLSNREIRLHLINELGINHRENYISTIWSKAIKLIVDAVELNYDEYLSKNYQKAWKQCTRCGEWLLRDSRNFVKKTKSLDGLTNRCKKCDKELRQKKN